MLAGLIITAHVLIPHNHHFHADDPLITGQGCHHGDTAASHLSPEKGPSHCHFFNYSVFARDDDQHADLQPVLFATVLSADLTRIAEANDGGNQIIPNELRVLLPVGYILEDSPLRAPPGAC